MATAEFSKFAGILNAALSQHHLLGFEIAQLESHHFMANRKVETLTDFIFSGSKMTAHGDWNYEIKRRLLPRRKAMDDIKKRWQEYIEELYKKDLHDPDSHDGMITNLEPDILKYEVKWGLGSITTNKASGGDGIPAELFQILKDYTVKVLLWFSQ